MTKKLSTEDLYTTAHIVGMTKAGEHKPEPMVVRDKNSLGETVQDTINDGVWGFADVWIRPARGRFVKFLKDRKIGYKAYEGGYKMPIHDFNQSLELKRAYAEGFAKVLKEHGIDAYGTSRMD